MTCISVVEQAYVLVLNRIFARPQTLLYAALSQLLLLLLLKLLLLVQDLLWQCVLLLMLPCPVSKRHTVTAALQLALMHSVVGVPTMSGGCASCVRWPCMLWIPFALLFLCIESHAGTGICTADS